MNTWGAQAAHVTLIPGAGPAREFGSVSAYSFALGASVVLLALVVMKSPRQLNARWRPADLRQRLVRLSRVLAGTWRNARSRFRQRVDLMLARMLGDADEQPQARQEPQNAKPSPRHAAPPRQPLVPPN